MFTTPVKITQVNGKLEVSSTATLKKVFPGQCIYDPSNSQ